MYFACTCLCGILWLSGECKCVCCTYLYTHGVRVGVLLKGDRQARDFRAGSFFTTMQTLYSIDPDLEPQRGSRESRWVERCCLWDQPLLNSSLVPHISEPQPLTPSLVFVKRGPFPSPAFSLLPFPSVCPPLTFPFLFDEDLNPSANLTTSQLCDFWQIA